MASKSNAKSKNSSTGNQKSDLVNGNGGNGHSSVITTDESERELVVIAQPEAGLRVARDGTATASNADVSALTNVLEAEGATLHPLFGVNEERLRNEAATVASTTGETVPDLSVYYRVHAPDDRLEAIAERLRELDTVEAAYVKPPAELPQHAQQARQPDAEFLNTMTPQPFEPPMTPNFTARQGYLNVAPGGIDAHYAHTLPGGRGAGTRIIDIEGAWRFTHEDLLQNQGGVVGGTQSSDLRWRNHGTAVVGEFGGDRNTVGITGICPDANVRAFSIFGGPGSAGAIRQASLLLNPGDIILIELHRAGPRLNFQPRDDQRGYIAVEWWQDDFDAIRFATTRGVIVVEAAGNGAENLDDPIYNVRPADFPASWRNPFNRANRDSGAVLVGAGAPPPGTHGRNHGPDRSRLDFSNYGASVDAQGWGREVTTCGYGDLQGGSNEDLWYTDRFSGTSSASPIVVGALACVQGILRARSRPQLTPARARQLLRTTGSSQQDAPGRPRTQRIGNRPNLRQMIQNVTGIKLKLKHEIKENIKELKELKPEIEGKNFQKELKPEIEGKNLQIEGKHLQKEFKEGKEVQENLGGGGGTINSFEGQNGRDGGFLSVLASRLDELEQRLATGRAFIREEERPDVGGEIVGYAEDDIGTISES